MPKVQDIQRVYLISQAKGRRSLSGCMSEDMCFFSFKIPGSQKPGVILLSVKYVPGLQMFLLFFQNTPTVYANRVEDKKPEKKGKIENVGSIE